MHSAIQSGAVGLCRRARAGRTIGGLILALLATTALAGADVAAAADYYEVRARHSNKCLDVAYASTSHGANVIQADCWGGRNQQWRLEYAGGDAYYLIARHSDMCLDVAHASYLHGANVIQAYCWGGQNQRWKLVHTDSGFYRLVAKHSNMCLDVAHGSIAHGANVLQATCWYPGYNQQWVRVYRTTV